MDSAPFLIHHTGHYISAALAEAIEALRAVQKAGPIESREWVFINAALNYRWKAIPVILENGAVSEDACGKALGAAAIGGNLEFLHLLLEVGPVSEKYRGKALTGAALNTRWNVIPILLENGAVSEDARGEALYYAAMHGELEALKALLKVGPILKKWRESALVQAAAHAQLNVIPILLENGVVSGEVRSKALCEAAQHGKIEVFKALKSDLIPDATYEEAYILAETNGHFEMAKRLQEYNPIGLQKRLYSKYCRIKKRLFG